MHKISAKKPDWWGKMSFFKEDSKRLLKGHEIKDWFERNYRILESNSNISHEQMINGKTSSKLLRFDMFL